jgi:hypothetical protein
MAGPHQDNGVPWGGSPSQDRLRSIPDARERAIATQHTPPPPQAPPPTLQQTASTYQPGEPSAESYAGVFDPYDMDQPMATGFGSVFGASSGTTGSSETVQDSLNFMIEDTINLMDIPSDDPFFDTNRTIADDWIGRKYTQMGQGPGGEREFWDPGYYDPRQETLDKLRFLQAGLPTRQVDQQTFFNEMVDPYAADTAEALEKGIFSGAMREGLFDPKGLRRLITSYGSGVAKPLFANVARGGIVSLVGE